MYALRRYRPQHGACCLVVVNRTLFATIVFVIISAADWRKGTSAASSVQSRLAACLLARKQSKVFVVQIYASDSCSWQPRKQWTKPSTSHGVLAQAVEPQSHALEVPPCSAAVGIAFVRLAFSRAATSRHRAKIGRFGVRSTRMKTLGDRLTHGSRTLQLNGPRETPSDVPAVGGWCSGTAGATT